MLSQIMQFDVLFAVHKLDTGEELMSAITNALPSVTFEEQPVCDMFGAVFAKRIGCKTLFDLPVVHAESLGITSGSGGIPHPNHFDNLNQFSSAARGLLQGERAFIAVKKEMLDPKTGLVHDVAIDLIFQAFKHDKETYFIIESRSKTRTPFNPASSIRDEQLACLKDLLEGKTAKDSVLHCDMRLKA